MEAFNPQGRPVTSFKVPNSEELAHDYLWRVHKAAPGKGEVGIFNRSHYEDVLIVRVHDIVPKKVWSARYDQINEFEHMLTANKVIILKFMLHVSRDEQKRLFEERLADDSKNWKFRTGDLEDRAHWDAFTRAYRGILENTSTE